MTLSISIVTPTLGRPVEVEGLLENLAEQEYLPVELVLVDAGPPEDRRTLDIVKQKAGHLEFQVTYIEAKGGTAIQRNVGIEGAAGDLIALIDDDIRLQPDFFSEVVRVFLEDRAGEIGAVAGYIMNQFLDPELSPRWRWYRRLRLFSTFEPGAYDAATGYPINRYLQPPHTGIRPVDVMGAGCAVWRREVFDTGLRFDPFFSGFGVLEDAHLALRARRRWLLVENGRARCIHLRSSETREDPYEVARKTAVNYRFVFMDIVPERSLLQEARFWMVQVVDLIRLTVRALSNWDRASWRWVVGKFRGIVEAVRLRPSGGPGQSSTPANPSGAE